jgi:hypothetical protein
MKDLPACITCVNSGFLCSSCQTKLDEGELTAFELDLAKDLLKKENSDPDKFGYLKTISFLKAIDYEDVVIIVVGNKDKLKITPELIKWIKETYEIDTLIFIDKTKKPRPVVEDLIAPSKLLSLNEIFLATGDIEFKAVIKKDDKEKILFTAEELEELINELTGTITRIEFQ